MTGDKPVSDDTQNPATDPSGPLCDPVAAAAGARRLIERLEHEGPTPGQPFNWELAIAGLKKMIDDLEGE
jgi:hypothetical protein